MATNQTRTSLWITISALLVVSFAVMEAWPHRELDWKGTVVPLARKYAASDHNIEPLEGRRIVVTGCTSGIGLSLVRKLTQLGATVIGLGRNRAVLAQLEQEISLFHTVHVDQLDLHSVRAAAKVIQEKWQHVDILVNNAGIHEMKYLFGSKVSKQGYDHVFAVNYLSHFLLTELMAPVVVNENSTRPTLVQVASSFHWVVDGSDLRVDAVAQAPLAATNPTGVIFRSQRNYANSKLAQIYHARALKHKHPLWKKARVVSVCPGWVGTTIAGGNGGVGHRLMQRGFPVDGWGVSSVLLAMLDSSNSDDNDFYINSKFFLLGNPMLRFADSWWYTVGLRDVVGHIFAVCAQQFQKFVAASMPTRSSKESYDREIIDSLYRWSLSAIEDFR